MNKPNDKSQEPAKPSPSPVVNENKVTEGMIQHTTTPRNSAAQREQRIYRQEHKLGPDLDATHPLPHSGGAKTNHETLCTGTAEANRKYLPGPEKMMIRFSKSDPTFARAEVSDKNTLTHKISTVQPDGSLKPAPVSEVVTKLDARPAMTPGEAVKRHAQPGENTKDLYSAKPMGGCHPHVI